jgi:hypothetical protein
MTFDDCLGFVAALLAVATCQPAQATADGPDYYRVSGVLPGYFLDLRSQPGPGAPSLGHVSADSQCLRNLGCQGGVSFEEFSTLSSEAQKLRAAANPRWCKVDYRGTTGWVEGRFVAEGACPPGAEGGARKVSFPAGRSGVTLKGRIKGYEFVDYLLPAGAGQTLLVALNGSHAQNYFNVLPPGSEIAMFIGSSEGNRFERVAPTDGVYVLRVYLMRAAARRKAVSNYSLQVGVTGTILKPLPAKQDALIPGTPFHAGGSVPCKIAMAPEIRACDAFVIRRGLDGTATVDLRWNQGTSTVFRRLLLVKGKPVSSDATLGVIYSHEGDLLTVDVGAEEQYRIPDALPFGG